MADIRVARVVSNVRLRDNVSQVDFEMVEPAEIVYDAGQYIILHTVEQNGKVVKRSYSIASPPDPKRFSLCVKVVGAASEFISMLKPDDRVKFSGPWGKGKFTFPEKTEREIVMMASGTGFSPIHGLLQNCLPAHPDKQFLFLWGLKRESDIFHAETLNDMASKNPNFAFKIILSDPGQSWPGKTGMLSAVFQDETGALAGKEYFMAGNGAMIAAIESRLKSSGVAPEKIHKEIFFVDAESAP